MALDANPDAVEALRVVNKEKIVGSDECVPSGEHWKIDKIVGSTVTVSSGGKVSVGKLIGGQLVVEKGGLYELLVNTGGKVVDRNTQPAAASQPLESSMPAGASVDVGELEIVNVMRMSGADRTVPAGQHLIVGSDTGSDFIVSAGAMLTLKIGFASNVTVKKGGNCIIESDMQCDVTWE